jgi:hypothetical protein
VCMAEMDETHGVSSQAAVSPPVNVHQVAGVVIREVSFSDPPEEYLLSLIPHRRVQSIFPAEKSRIDFGAVVKAFRGQRANVYYPFKSP